MSDVDVVRSIYDAMHARDFEQLFTLLHPEVVITQDPALPWGGRFEGHDGFATFGLTLEAATSRSTAPPCSPPSPARVTARASDDLRSRRSCTEALWPPAEPEDLSPPAAPPIE